MAKKEVASLHDSLVADAKKAINKVFADPSVPRRVTWTSMVELMDEAAMLRDSLDENGDEEAE